MGIKFSELHILSRQPSIRHPYDSSLPFAAGAKPISHQNQLLIVPLPLTTVNLFNLFYKIHWRFFIGNLPQHLLPIVPYIQQHPIWQQFHSLPHLLPISDLIQSGSHCSQSVLHHAENFINIKK
jgi:hypothetical protein